MIRYEEGKLAEIFTLVLQGTMEENWYSTSMKDKSYVEISLEELDDILQGEQTFNLIQEGQEMGLLFRV